jgi:hypothetical protein
MGSTGPKVSIVAHRVAVKCNYPRDGALLRFFLAVVASSFCVTNCLAANPSDWADCRSQDLDLNIPACTRILGDPATAAADLVRAHDLRAKAYLSQHSYVSARRDFDEIVKVEPGNVAARVGRAISEFKLDEQGKAVLDYSVAKQISRGPLENLPGTSDDIRGLADLAARSPAPQAEIQSILDSIASNASRPPSNQLQPAPETALHQAGPDRSEECDRLAASPVDNTL